jgi:hypothetical protein
MIDETLTISKLSDDELYFFAATGFDEAKTKFMNDLSSEIQKHQDHDQQSHGNWAGESSPNDYGMSHRPAQGKDGGASLDDVTNGIYPDDVYSPRGVQIYGTGYKDLDKKAHAMIMEYKGKPDKEIRIYRAVPKKVSTNINTGDWVTPIKEYAVQHGESNLNNDYQILFRDVKAKEIFTSGDSWLEWGYAPELVEKHQQHDQQSHGNWAGGGGTIGDYSRAYKSFTLTEDEEDYLSDYGSSGYKDINNFLRLGLKSSNPEYQNYLSKAVTSMDNAIERAPLVENNNPLWRVFSPKAFLNLEIGKTYEDKGFMSTSLNDLSAKKNSEVKDNFMNVGGISQILGKILPNGKYKGISMNNTKVFNDFEEREFILPRNTQLTFLGFEQQNTTDDFERPIVENIAVFQRVN